MAGKYQTFGDFWNYNKLKIFAVVISVALIALAVSQCSLGKTLDLGVVHVSQKTDVDGEKFLECIKKDVELKKIGEELVLEFTPIYMPDDFSAAAELGSIEKAQIEITTGDSSLFILDGETVYSFKNDDIFYDLTKIADKYNISQEERYLSDDGKVMAISVDGNKYLEECSIFCDNLYIAIQNHLESKSEKYSNAFAALEYILNKGR